MKPHCFRYAPDAVCPAPEALSLCMAHGFRDAEYFFLKIRAAFTSTGNRHHLCDLCASAASALPHTACQGLTVPR